MIKNTHFKKYLLIISAILLTNYCFSQKENFIKLHLSNDFIKNKSFIKGFGISFERQMSKTTGIETGLLYRTYKVGGSIRSGDLFYDYTVNENHFSIPVLFKYYSTIIDFSVGPTLDYYGVWSINKNSSNLKVISDQEKKDFGLGVLARASKTIRIDEKLYLEPEIHFNPLLTIKRNFVGFGLSMKYKL